MNHTDLSIRQLWALAPLVPHFRHDDGREFLAFKCPDGNNGWITSWYEWKHPRWEATPENSVPFDVIRQFDPYK